MNFHQNKLAIFVSTFIIFIVIFFLARTSYATVVAPAPVLDSGQIEATILDIYHPANPQIDYGKIQIDKILEYSHHPNANYKALKVGDIIPVYFQWGAQKTTVDLSPTGPSDNDINLPGLEAGDRILVSFSGCPEDKGCGNGWTLYEYSIVSKIDKPIKQGELDKTVKIKNAAEISSILVEQKQVTLVESIEVDSNNPITPTTPQSLNGKTILSVGFPLKSGHKLYMEYDASIVPMGKLFDLEVSSGNLTQVKTADELLKLTGQINTKEQALAFVKFFTSEPTRHLLKPNLFSGIEPSDLYVQMPSSLSRFLTSAKADRVGGQWVIERDLLLYPNWTSQKLQTPAQLVRSHETISQAGTYTFSVKQVLAEGDEVNNLLPYYE